MSQKGLGAADDSKVIKGLFLSFKWTGFDEQILSCGAGRIGSEMLNDFLPIKIFEQNVLLKCKVAEAPKEFPATNRRSRNTLSARESFCTSL